MSDRWACGECGIQCVGSDTNTPSYDKWLFCSLECKLAFIEEAEKPSHEEQMKEILQRLTIFGRNFFDPESPAAKEHGRVMLKEVVHEAETLLGEGL